MIPRTVRHLAAGLAVSAAMFASAQQPAPAAPTPPPPPAFAAPNLSDAGVRGIASSCAICHGTQGRPVAGSSVAALAGRPQQEIVDIMKAFKDGKREATIMHQIAKGYSDAEIAAIAGYFSRQPR